MRSAVELRLRGERAVLRGGATGGEAVPRETLGADLADALEEWARVASAVLRAGSDAGAEVVSQRGRQLAGRVAAALGVPVSYRDPVTDHAVVVRGPRHPEPEQGEETPWATGLTVSFVIGVFVLVAMLALAHALAVELAGWVAVVASAVVTAGLAPSLWLGRRARIVRWLVFGAVGGMVVAWLGVLLIAFSV